MKLQYENTEDGLETGKANEKISDCPNQAETSC